MARFIKSNRYALLIFSVVVAGCALPAGRSKPTALATVASPSRTLPAGVARSSPSATATPAVSQAAYQAPAEAPPEPPMPAGPGTMRSMVAADADDPFAAQAELSLDQLVTEVQARNPSLQAASDAWRAATERYPQAISLDDPMFAFMISPRGVGTDNGGGWMVQASQKIPWAGKRALRGEVAAAEANVMQGDIGDTRLRLAEAAKVALFDYYMAWRQTEVNTATEKLVRQFREIALKKYEAGEAAMARAVSQQDVLQADVELADLATHSAELSRDQKVAAARINTLLHRAADHPLPPPPKEVPLPDGLPAVENLQQAAVGSRPDLYAQLSRIQTEQANLELACREYYPDLNLAARYDGFMPQEMRPQVGMDLNVPIRYSRRSAAVREASNRVAQRRAEYQNVLDQVRFEVQSSYTRVVQAAEVVRLYRDKTLPASQRSLESAVANYTTGSLDFLRLLDAERQLNNQREKYYGAIAEYHRRLAELERAVGERVR